MERQNVTLSLPKNLIRQAKSAALKRHKSLSEFLRESLEDTVSAASNYKKAMDRQRKLMQSGFDLGTGGVLTASRDELHERR